MNRRLLLTGGIILLLALLAASLTTTWARQVSQQNKARDHALAARAAVAGALQRAAADGLRPGELAPYRDSLAAISRRVAPSAVPFWNSHLTTFYTGQNTSYHRLVRAIQRGEAQVAARERAAARRAVHTLAGQIQTARSLGLPVRSAQSAWRTAGAQVRNSTLPRQYQVIPAEVQKPAAALAAAITVRHAQINDILSAAHGSRAGVVRRARTEVAGVQGRLSLLGLLTSRAATYQAALARSLRQVQAQPTALAAAGQSLRLDGQVARAAADYRRTVPHKMIVVSTEKQSASLYQNGRVIYRTPVTTGGPELPTDHGVFHIYLKVSPFVFHSPWPPSSPYYYVPTPITYWMPFDGGEGLHDAWWRSNFGPGSNYQPTDLGTGNYILGTHGCVNLPFAAAQYVWNWAPVGTTVVVV